MTHILLVEDNPIDARLVHYTFAELKDWPTKITWVDDGQKALWFLRSLEEGGVDEPPALMMLDVNLPKYDGLQVLEAFRNSTVVCHLPIFLFSSSPAGEIEALAESKLLRADGYFEKPYCLQGFNDVAKKIRSFQSRTVDFSYASAHHVKSSNPMADHRLHLSD